MYKLTEIHTYPIKSCSGISLQTAKIEKRGLQYDRRWMLIDKRNDFITQRVHHKMALINIEIIDDQMKVSHKSQKIEPLFFPLNNHEFSEDDKTEAQIWKDRVSVLKCKREYSQWFSEVLDHYCTLVYMPDETNRFVEKEFAKNDEIVGFADAYPFLIIGEESIKYLNNKLNKPVHMNRFRPNFVFSGGAEHDEDFWSSFKIGENVFHGVKLCGRCVLTTVDQKTAEKSKEPLATLAKYRTRNGKIVFGQNLVHEKEGVVNIGDIITVL